MRALALILAALSTGQDRKPDRWEADIRAFEEKDRENPPPQGAVLFVGSSTIRMWKTAESFPDIKTINRGFGGSQVADTLRYADRIVLPRKPKIVVLYAGSNDLAAGKTPEAVFEDWKALVKKIREALPATRILFIEIKPTVKRWAQRGKQKRLNSLVAEHARSEQGAGFIENDAAFLGEDGKPRADLLLPDGLHLNEAGYRVLNGLVRPYLTGEK